LKFDIYLIIYLELDNESMMINNSMNRFSFDMRTVLDDDRRRLLKKYRETKKKAKLLFRRQADQGKLIYFLFFKIICWIFFLEILPLLETFNSSNESKLTLVNELIYECQRLYPSFEPRLIQYKMNIVKEDEPSSSSSSLINDDYM
jgi:hypothetical protein